jgi:hypothetical protein
MTGGARMAGWEDGLSPMIRARLAEIGEARPEEKERMREEGLLNSVLAEFYKGHIDPNTLRQRLKGSKLSTLKEVQLNLIHSLSVESTPSEFKRRKEAILAVESLKEEHIAPVIEVTLNRIGDLQRTYKEKRQEILNKLRQEVERNSQLRVIPVRTPDGRTSFQAALSLDEGLRARLADSLSGHERKCREELAAVIDELNKLVDYSG